MVKLVMASQRVDPLTESESQLEKFITKFSADNQLLIGDVRAALRARLPTANELVYDNFNFFVIGYCASEKPSHCIVSLVASARSISLSFYHGADIKDEAGLLQGEGSQNRFIRLENATVLADPRVEALIEQACHVKVPPLPTTGGGKLIIRSVSEKQRPRQ
jgi:hypothetical protein